MTTKLNKISQDKIKLPNLIVAGVVKGGTTSLYTYLSLHPEICCSIVKETCYFSFYRYGQLDSRYSKALNPFKQYQGYFSHCKNQKYILEATPGYFEGGNRVIKEIKKQLGNDVKIMIILRNPVDRLISFFKYKKSMLYLKSNLSLEDYVRHCESIPCIEKIKQENDTYWGIEGGCYANYIADWLDEFGDSIKILFFDDLKNGSRALLINVCSWLEIDASIFETASLDIENKSVNFKNKTMQQFALFINSRLEQFWRSNPNVKTTLRNIYYSLNGAPHQEEISDETLKYIQYFYAPYNKQLAQQLINRGYTKLPSWLLENNLTVENSFQP